MNLKPIVLTVGLLGLCACEKVQPNPEMLKGANFVATAEADTQITLSFAKDEMRVNGQIVNLYNGSYEVEGDKIKFSPFASTMMMGPQEAMAVEQEYFQFMPTVESYSLKDGVLTLKNAEGKELVFEQVVAEETATVEEVEAVEVTESVAAQN